MPGLIAFYIAQYAGSGAAMPFIPLWFQARGFGPLQLAVLLAAPYFGRGLLGPLLAVWADRFRLRRTPIALMAFTGSLATLALLALRGFWGCLIAFFLGSVLLNCVGPLGDVIGLREARARGRSFGIPRGAGTAAYLLANVVVGYVLNRAGLTWLILWIVLAAASMGAGALFMLPATPVERSPRVEQVHPLQAVAEPLRQPLFMVAILAAGCIQASHGFYYGFSAILWQNKGLREWIGPLWACAGLSEVMFLWLLGPWRERMGAERLLLLSGATSVFRWAAMSFSPPLAALFALQALHALTYAGSYLASLGLVERLCPPRAISAGLLLNAALSNGILIGLIMLSGGSLYARFGAQAYWSMGLMALIGTVGALRVERPGRKTTSL